MSSHSNRKHRVTVSDAFYVPLPMKTEAVSGPVAVLPVVQAELLDPLGVDAPEIIDESERLLSAGELYADALEGFDGPAPAKLQLRVTAVTKPRMQLWGAGTSGIPRKGSRTIRLFRAEPAELFAALRAEPTAGGLRLDPDRFEDVCVLGEMELHGTGVLAGAFATKSSLVEVSLRVARFNAIFSAVEVMLVSKRHPRRFFTAAHDAIQSLRVPTPT